MSVVYLTELGLWSHEHINPLYLNFDVNLKVHDEKGKAYIDAMIAFSEYLRFSENENDENYFFNRAIQTAENYRDICFESCVKNRKLPLECAKRKHNMII